ncbi:MAG TPA: HEAT repeat domain-containing protein [Vicinamibacteria bacterium]|nr:HEAT repeat domain-containing protein [Vicinamibacteria bacterium]
MKLARTLGILEAEVELTLLLGLTHFLVAGAHSLFDIGATALLIGNLGPDALPQVYSASAIVLIFAGLFVTPLVDRLDRALFFSLLLAGSAALVLLTSQGSAYRALYVVSYLLKGLFFLQYWLFAGDLLDLRQAKRVFPVLLGFSLTGGLVASMVASQIPRFLPSESLLAFSGALMVAAVVPVQWISHRWRRRLRYAGTKSHRVPSLAHRIKSDIDVSFQSPLVRALSIYVFLLALLAQILDFLLGKAAHAAFASPSGTVAVEGLASFYALLNAVVIGVGALVQFFVANRLINSVGVTRSQLLAPITFFVVFAGASVAWLAGGAFFLTVVAARATQRAFRISLVRTSTDLIYNAIPGERRGRAKAFKETILEPLGVLAGGLLLMASSELPLQYVLVGATGLSIVLLTVTGKLKERYVASLVLVLKERSRYRFAFPSFVVRKAKTPMEEAGVSGLRRALDDDEASIRLLAVEVASELKEPEAATLLVDRVRDEPDPQVRSRMVSALGRMVRNRGERAEGGSVAEVDPGVRANAMETLAQDSLLAEMGKGTRMSPHTPDSSPRRVRENGATRKRDLFALARSQEKGALERIVHYLEEGDGATRHVAARALEGCGEIAVGVLTLALWSSDVEARRYVIRALDRIGTSSARQALLPVLSLEAEEAYYELVQLQAIGRLPTSPALGLLKDSIAQRVERGRRNAHEVLRAVFLGEPGMRLILSNLNHPDRFIRSSALEALEVRVDPALLGGVLPLFEHDSPRAVAEQGAELFDFPSRSPLDALLELTRHRSAWIRACAVYAVGHAGTLECLERLEQLTRDDDELTRLNAIEAMGRLGDETTLRFLSRLETSADETMKAYRLEALGAIRRRQAAQSAG